MRNERDQSLRGDEGKGLIYDLTESQLWVWVSQRFTDESSLQQREAKDRLQCKSEPELGVLGPWGRTFFFFWRWKKWRRYCLA